MQNKLCRSHMYSDDFLMHHGIIGMRWGKKNGPPYPLDQKVSSRIKSGENPVLKRSRMLSGSSTTKTKPSASVDDRKTITKADKVKAHLVTPLATLATSAGFVARSWIMSGGVFLHPAFLAPPVIGLGITGYRELKNAVARHKDKKLSEIQAELKTDKKTGLKVKPKEMTIKEDAKLVNPSYKDLYAHTKHNCALCTAAYDLRRRGYAVMAQKAKTGYDEKEVASWYKGGKFKDIKMDYGLFGTKKTINNIKSEIESQGKGARGFFCVDWASGGGHAMAYEVTDKGLQIVDAQSGKANESMSDIVSHADSCYYMRTDNLKPNYKLMKEEVVR